MFISIDEVKGSSLFSVKQLPREMAFERGNKFMSITCVVKNNIWFFWKFKPIGKNIWIKYLAVGEKFCCRVMECAIKVIYFKHCRPVTQGNHGANGTEEIMTQWPEWICNTGMPHEYHLFLPWRIKLRANKQMPNNSFSLCMKYSAK